MSEFQKQTIRLAWRNKWAGQYYWPVAHQLHALEWRVKLNTEKGLLLVEEWACRVFAHPKKYSPSVRLRAIRFLAARGFNEQARAEIAFRVHAAEAWL